MLSDAFRQMRARRRLQRLPTVVVSVKANHYKAFTAPAPDYSAVLHDAMANRVGTAAYALSPLADRIYVFDIVVAPEHRRRGFATAFLWGLARTHRVPITPVHVLGSAVTFWAGLHVLQPAGVIVTPALSASEMDSEAARWAHLRPDAERLAAQISDRLGRLGEPWELAVGRGLEP